MVRDLRWPTDPWSAPGPDFRVWATSTGVPAAAAGLGRPVAYGTLNLWLGQEEGRAALYDATGKRLRNFAEEVQAGKESEARAQESEARAQESEARAQESEARAQESEARAQALEAELRQLRGKL